MAKLRHFSKMTETEVRGMIEACKDAAIQYTDKIGVSGLSEGGSFNVYNAISEAIWSEFYHAEETRICMSLNKCSFCVGVRKCEIQTPQP